MQVPSTPGVTWLVMAGLATWRASTFVVYDEGPWRMGVRLRGALFRAGLGALVSCVHCVSLWIALAVTATVRGDPVSWLLCWWAIAGLASWLETWLGGVRDGRSALDEGTRE